jgi:Arc/MetJ-type ribon-helix-helix transcriptional regulator
LSIWYQGDMGQDDERATVELSRHALGLLEQAVTLGHYGSPSELIEDAFRSRTGDDLVGYPLAELRSLGDEGEASGVGQGLTIAEIQQAALSLANTR